MIEPVVFDFEPVFGGFLVALLIVSAVGFVRGFF